MTSEFYNLLLLDILPQGFPSFSFSVPSSTAWLLTAAAVLALGAAVAVTATRLHRVNSCIRKCSAYDADTAVSTMPSVSVVVLSQDNSQALETLLPAILNQQYNGKIEVVVVNDGESASVQRVVAQAQLTHPNVYLTYTPDEARNLSRRKLAITLGVKAARHDVVLLTHACCLPPENGGDTWLQRIMRHFNSPDTGLVLGYASPDFASLPRSTRTLRFDVAADSATWLSAAIAGHPYMGTSYNIAYRRRLFFDNKGFSRSLQLNNGDDDIFVSEIAASTHTAVELSPESTLTFSHRNLREIIETDRANHVFTSRFVTKTPRRLTAMGILLMWLAIGCAAALVALNPLNLTCIYIAAAAVIATLVLPSIPWCKTVTSLTGRHLRLSLPWIIITRPWRQAMLRLKDNNRNNKNYTWN